MSNFDPHELKPDSNDRPNTNRAKKNEPSYLNVKTRLKNLNISRQHLMIAIGILVLLIIILTIFSALKSPVNNVQPQPQNIALPSQDNTAENDNIVPNNSDPLANQSTQPSTITPPLVQSTQPPEITMSPENTTTSTMAPSDNMSQQQTNNVTTAPQQPAASAPATTTNTTKPQSQAPAKQTSIADLPSNYVTLQLSSASQPKTLEAFAKKQNLEQYWIYETRRDNKPWFVLIYGAYPNVQQANQAISTLPADVQAKKPWVKPIRQVQQEAKQR